MSVGPSLHQTQKREDFLGASLTYFGGVVFYTQLKEHIFFRRMKSSPGHWRAAE